MVELSRKNPNSDHTLLQVAIDGKVAIVGQTVTEDTIESQPNIQVGLKTFCCSGGEP